MNTKNMKNMNTKNMNSMNTKNMKNMNSMNTKNRYKSVANYISLIPLVYWIFIYVYYCVSFIGIVKPLFTLKYIFGFTTIVFISELLKKLMSPYLGKVAKRPEGARDCDFFSCNGNVEGNPGLPSTHMAIVGFFVTYNLFIIKSPISKVNQHLFYFLNVVLLVLTAWARFYKRCHNLSQILTGTILGGIYASIIFIL